MLLPDLDLLSSLCSASSATVFGRYQLFSLPDFRPSSLFAKRKVACGAPRLGGAPANDTNESCLGFSRSSSDAQHDSVNRQVMTHERTFSICHPLGP